MEKVLKPTDSSAETQTGTASAEPSTGADDSEKREREIGGRKGPDPTRYGDWEKNGRCIDF